MAKKVNQLTISPTMREYLAANRAGKLTRSQVIDLALAPVITALVWLVPLGVALLPVLLRVTIRLQVVLPIVIVIYGGMVLWRAIRYSRAQVRFARLTSPSNVVPAWTFIRAVKLHHDSGAVLRFTHWIAPRIRLRRKQVYLVYYLHEGGDAYTLLSIAPADHPDVAQWQPTERVKKRLPQHEN